MSRRFTAPRSKLDVKFIVTHAEYTGDAGPYLSTIGELFDVVYDVDGRAPTFRVTPDGCVMEDNGPRQPARLVGITPDHPEWVAKRKEVRGG